MTNYAMSAVCIKGHRREMDWCTNVCNICGGTWWLMSDITRCAVCRKYKIHTYFLNKTNGDKWVCEPCMDKWLSMSNHLLDK